VIHRVWGDKELDANVKTAVGVQLLIPQTLHGVPTYVTGQTEAVPLVRGVER
jgi:hypothetical protein